jgi:hypothetical protein
MILLGHIGPTLGMGAWLAKARLDRSAMLWLGLCAVLPDLVDKPLLMLGLAPAQTGRVWGHTLLFSLIWCLACRFWGKPLWPWALATPGHLILDAMWDRPHTLLWPLLGNVFDLPERFFANYFLYWRWLYFNEPWTLAWLLAWEALGLALAANILRRRAGAWASCTGMEARGLPE